MKRMPELAEERYRSLCEKIYAADGTYTEIIRRRDLERRDVFELEQAARLRAQNPGQQRIQNPGQELGEDIEARSAERLARARERLAQFNRRFTEIGEEKMQLVRLRERVETYLLSAGYSLPDDDEGIIRNVGIVRGSK